MTRAKLHEAARDWGWLLAIIVSLLTLIAVVVIFRAKPETAEVVGIDTGDTIQVTPREVGVNFDVNRFCNDPDTKVSGAPMTDAPKGGNRYIASRGQESVNWPDSPEGENTAAMWYHPAAVGDKRHDGSPAVVGEQLSDTAEITKPAAECMKKKAGK